jgi:chromate transporter
VLPSFVVLCVLSGIYLEYGTVTVVAGVVRGLAAAVVGLVAAAVLRVGSRVIHTLAAVLMAGAAFGLIVAGMPFPFVVAVAALIGYVAGRYRPTLLGKPKAHGGDVAGDAAPARIESPSRLRRRLVWSLVIWLVPVAVLVAVGGLVGDLAAFFTAAALVTFGGAYAVLPFVANQAVHHYGWLSARDMVAGLALGESTPGPLIMVNTFVGFAAGYHVGGGLAWGVLGATIVTFCTFVPCFVFIINGAPIIDRIKTTGPAANALNGVTIAVVGVIGGLAVFVADHALIVDGRPDWVLTPLAIGAFVGVWRYRVGVLRVVAVCAAVGLLDSLIR